MSVISAVTGAGYRKIIPTNLPEQRWSPSFLLKHTSRKCVRPNAKVIACNERNLPAWKFLETTLVFNTLRLLIARKEFIFNGSDN